MMKMIMLRQEPITMITITITISITKISQNNSRLIQSRIRENQESWKILLLESGILGFGIWKTAQGSRNPLRIGIQNPSSTDKDWNPVPGVQNPQSGIQDLRLSWIPLNRPKILSRHPDKCPASLLRT